MEQKRKEQLLREVLALAKLTDPLFQEKLHVLIEHFESQEQALQKVSAENQILLKEREERIAVLHQIDEKKNKVMLQQSKMAAMGEMMDIIAHQWKQPLNTLSMINDMLKSDFEANRIDKNYIDDITDTTSIQIKYMVNTLNEFRKFFRPSKENDHFTIHSALESVKVILKDELIKQNVTLRIEVDKKIKVTGAKNEFVHLFINFIKNSIEAFNENGIHERFVTIRADNRHAKTIIEVEDNAGGIPPYILNDIFKLNFTTKEKTSGTGIGLYMSMQIVQKHNGILSVANTPEGAIFTITL
ncbi:MAG: HAMP domain-containing sensor histidine kinase [Thiovulaceae bacterium]|nr:HAMP domain-containing sensor histidine kinase [Sulfurimonadaceae bacterium]